MTVRIKELPDYEVAFFRNVGSYADTSAAWDKLGHFVAQNELFPPNQHFIGISLDNPELVEASACRYDACVTIPQGFSKANHTDVQFQTLTGGLYALYQFYDTADQFGLAYQHVFGQWLPASEYEADAKHCLEFIMNNPADDPEGKCKVDLYVPIKPQA